MYKVAIYVNDYLLLLELVAKLDEEFPNIDYSIFGDKAFEKSLKDSAEGYVLTDLSEIEDYDILITLSKPTEDSKYIKEFDGTVIDISGYEFAQDTEVLSVDEPIRKILKNIAVPVLDTSVVLELPACIYGKNGVEDLMNQTKGIFTFENIDSAIFKQRIAFNKHFNPVIAGLPVGKTVDDFAESGGEVSIRLSSLSTVFVLDVYAKDKFGLKDDDGYFVVEGFFTTSDASERDDIIVYPRRNGLTFVADYVRIIVNEVFGKIREVVR